jgi:hypothetical protein
MQKNCRDEIFSNGEMVIPLKLRPALYYAKLLHLLGIMKNTITYFVVNDDEHDDDSDIAP